MTADKPPVPACPFEVGQHVFTKWTGEGVIDRITPVGDVYIEGLGNGRWSVMGPDWYDNIVPRPR
jgi:hypothetical protein